MEQSNISEELINANLEISFPYERDIMNSISQFNSK